MLVVLAAFFFWFQACPAEPVSSKEAEGPITNLEWLSSLMDSVAGNLSLQGLLAGGDPILIKVVANDSLFAAIQVSMLQEKLLGRKMRVIAKANAGPYLSLTLKWARWSVDYTEVRGRSDVTQRNLSALFFVEVVDRENKVIFARRREHEHQDILSLRDREAVATASLPFTLGGRQGALADGHPLWEKAFLFAISATVVYLFYSIRSQ